jgi:4-oxalocrotonate tautomerase
VAPNGSAPGNQWSCIMSLITMKMIEGVYSPAQKKRLVHDLTETVIAIAGEARRGVITVILEEVKGGDWGIGGQAFTADDVRRLEAERAS